MRKRKLESNIWKLYLIKATRSFMLIIPVIVLFFQENGMTMKQVFLLQSLFSVAVLVLEVPTGYFSDCFGRKKSIIIGGVIATLGYVVYSQSYGFWGFLVAEVLLGIGISFISGADSAMLYDTLLERGRQTQYKKVEGRGMSIGMLSEGTASILGGLLALVSLRFPLYWDILTTFATVPIALTLIEPKRHGKMPEGNSMRNMLKLVKYTLHDHIEIKWLVIYSSVAGASTLTMVWMIQPYLKATQVPLGLFGVIWAALLFTAALVSWNAQRIEKFFGRKVSLVSLVVLPVLGYILLSSFWFAWSGIFILLFYVVRGINNPVILDYINGLVPSEIRATVLSVKNLVGRLIFSIVGPIIGWTVDAYSLKTALAISGATFLVFGLVSLAFMMRRKAL